MTMKAFAALALACFITVPAHAARFTLDDLNKIVRVTDPQISPDGKTIAVIIGRANLKEDLYDTDLVLVDIATNQSRTLTHDRRGLAMPRWSPNGDRIAYLAQDADKKPQLFVLPLGGGDSIQLTHVKTRVSQLAWRTDGSALAFVATDEEPEKKDQAKFDDAFEVGNSDYLQRTRALPLHIWIVPAVGGEAKRLTSGAWSLPVNFAPSGPPSVIDWSHDGRSILFVKVPSPLTGDGEASTVQLLDVATGQAHALTGVDRQEHNPVFSPDGTQVLYGYPRNGLGRNENEVLVMPTGGGKGADVTQGIDRNIGRAIWMPDNKTLLAAATDGTTGAFWLQPIGGTPRRLNVGKLSPRADMTVGPNGEIAFTATESGRPAELYLMASATATPVRLTDLQTAIASLELGRQETVKWTSDNVEVDGVVTYPPDYVAGKKYPLVLYIHGGPTGTSLESFSTFAQLFAAQGWITFEPNYRGSDNSGNKFQTAINGDAGAGPGRDVMAGVEALKKRGFVDETKIAVSGWSYGGYMTTWLLGNYPTVWKAAVAGAAVTDFVDQYTLGDTNVRRAVAFGGSPYTGDRMKAYREQSPITYASNIKAPTLILSDVGDWRVTITQSYKLFHALKDNGVTTRFFAYPVGGHFPEDPIRSRDILKRWIEWLAPYLNSPAT
jgi:dipeptidyl aminopeptidase/acylaminoacyl peptidase